MPCLNSKFDEALFSKKHLHGGVNMFDKICLALVIIGSLNWGLVGLFQFDLVAWLFGGTGALLSRIVYIVIALAGVWCISLLVRSFTDRDMDRVSAEH